jgi:hypothetical protein
MFSSNDESKAEFVLNEMQSLCTFDIEVCIMIIITYVIIGIYIQLLYSNRPLSSVFPTY